MWDIVWEVECLEHLTTDRKVAGFKNLYCIFLVTVLYRSTQLCTLSILIINVIIIIAGEFCSIQLYMSWLQLSGGAQEVAGSNPPGCCIGQKHLLNDHVLLSWYTVGSALGSALGRAGIQYVVWSTVSSSHTRPPGFLAEERSLLGDSMCWVRTHHTHTHHTHTHTTHTHTPPTHKHHTDSHTKHIQIGRAHV